MKKAKELDFVTKKALRLTKNDQAFFKYHYNIHDDFLDDFEIWMWMCDNTSKRQAQINKKSLRNLWQDVDSTLSMRPNHLTDDNVDDHFITPRILDLRQFNELTDKEKNAVPYGRKPFQGETIKNRVYLLETMMRFLRSRKVYIGINLLEMDQLKNRCREFLKRLTNLVNERKIDVRQKKADNLITPEKATSYGKSDHVQGVVKFIKSLDKPASKIKVKKQQVIDCRDFFIVNL